jgi:tetratricopeptide (TPR) repeat protein
MLIFHLQFRWMRETKRPHGRCIFEQPQLQHTMPDSNRRPASPEGHLLVQQARASAEAGQWQSALVGFDEAERVNTDWGLDPDFLNDRAVALFHNDRAHESIALLDKAINLQPQYGYRYAARGWMKQALRDIQGAIADYEKAIELDPEDAITLNNLGLLEEQIGRMQSAKERFAAADAMDRILDETAISKESTSKAERTTTPQAPAPAPPPTPVASTPWTEVTRALFTQAGRKEFLEFIRNGFKLKG